MSKAELGQRLTDRVMTMDAVAVASCYAPDAQLISPHGTANGRDEIQAFFGGWFESFSDHVISDVLSEEEDVLVCDSVARLTHSAPVTLPSGEVLPATGRRVTVSAREYLTFDGDLIKTHRMEFDPEALFRQLTA